MIIGLCSLSAFKNAVEIFENNSSQQSVPGQHLGPSTLPCRRSLTISSRPQFLAFS